MLYSYSECLEKYGSKYNINKIVESGKLFKQEKGIYSDERYVPTVQIISHKYPKAVFTMNSAFYYHGLTDTVPESYYLLTDKNATKIRDKKVRQLFDNNNSLGLGRITMKYNGTEISIFNRERMLVELIRNKNKLPFDYYKEIIASYRKLIYELDIQAVQEYAMQLPKKKLVMETLQLEVF